MESNSKIQNKEGSYTRSSWQNEITLKDIEYPDENFWGKNYLGETCRESTAGESASKGDVGFGVATCYHGFKRGQKMLRLMGQPVKRENKRRNKKQSRRSRSRIVVSDEGRKKTSFFFLAFMSHWSPLWNFRNLMSISLEIYFKRKLNINFVILYTLKEIFQCNYIIKKKFNVIQNCDFIYSISPKYRN